MGEKGILHIKLFEYLIKKDKAYGYVQIRDFLIENFEDEEHFKDRGKMNQFLKTLNSNGFIDIKRDELKGIDQITYSGFWVTRNKISCLVRINPKAVDLYKDYKKTRFDKHLRILLALFAFTSLCIALYNLKKPDKSDYNKLQEKLDSITTVIKNMKEEQLKPVEKQLKQEN